MTVRVSETSINMLFTKFQLKITKNTDVDILFLTQSEQAVLCSCHVMLMIYFDIVLFMCMCSVSRSSHTTLPF
jgi:hypothetical protein